MLTLAKKFLKDDSGVAAAEYAILAALITACLVAAVPAVTTALTNTFTAIANNI